MFGDGGCCQNFVLSLEVSPGSALERTQFCLQPRFCFTAVIHYLGNPRPLTSHLGIFFLTYKIRIAGVLVEGIQIWTRF